MRPKGAILRASRIPYILISPLAKGNAYQSTVNFTHSSTLRTLQEIFQVGGSSPTGYLGAAANVLDDADLFQSGVIPSTVPEPASVILALIGIGLLVALSVVTGRSSSEQLAHQLTRVSGGRGWKCDWRERRDVCDPTRETTGLS